MTTPTVPPDTVAPGQTGHIDAHNQISDVLNAILALVQAQAVMQWGTATLTSGSVSVSLPAIASGSVVLVSRMTPAGTLGHLSVPTVSAGSGFTVTSSSGSDDSLLGWLVLS
jgi:hypothetical protein